jgi:hypothetical protein
MKTKAILLLSAAGFLAACGGGSSGVSNNPTSFNSLPNQELTTIISNQDGSGVASAYRLGNSYVIYANQLADLDLNAQTNIDPNNLTVLEEGADYAFLEGSYVSNGNEKYLFVYAKQIGTDETLIAGLARNANAPGGEIVQAYGDVVSGQVPVGDVTYRGYNLVTATDQTQIDSGTFTMRVNFQNNTGSLSGSGEISFVDATSIAVNSSNGTFSSDAVRLGYIDGESTSGFLRGNFHGNGATGVTGIYGNTGELTVVGVIAGSR